VENVDLYYYILIHICFNNCRVIKRAKLGAIIYYAQVLFKPTE